MKPKDIKVKPYGSIKNAKITILPDSPDHKNWIETDEKDKNEQGYRCYVIAYAPNFGYLWKAGRIDDENLAKATKGEKFEWSPSGIGGHAC